MQTLPSSSQNSRFLKLSTSRYFLECLLCVDARAHLEKEEEAPFMTSVSSTSPSTISCWAFSEAGLNLHIVILCREGDSFAPLAGFSFQPYICVTLHLHPWQVFLSNISGDQNNEIPCWSLQRCGKSHSNCSCDVHSRCSINASNVPILSHLGWLVR